LHLRVDLPDGRYTLVPEGGDEGATEELQHVKASPGALTPSFEIYAIMFGYVCAFYIPGVEWKP
jgi:hypothetical protein